MYRKCFVSFREKRNRTKRIIKVAYKKSLDTFIRNNEGVRQDFFIS